SVDRPGSWCWTVKSILESLNLLQTWNTETVGIGPGWMSAVKAYMMKRECTLWRQRMEQKPKLDLYRGIKVTLSREQYIDFGPRWRWRTLAMLRSGSSDLRIETGRWEGLSREM